MSSCQGRHLPRVLFAAAIDPSQKFGSFEEQTLSLCRAFRDRSGLFLPLFMKELGPEAGIRYREMGLRTETLDLMRIRFRTLLQLLLLIRRERIEVIHWNFYEPIKNGYVWSLSLLAPSVRHFYTDHNSRPSQAEPRMERFRGFFKRLMFRRFERILCVSDFVLMSLRLQGPRQNLSRLSFLVNTERFAPSLIVRSEVRQKLEAAESFVALVVAHLIPEKGIDVALRALAKLPESATLWVVGGGPERDGLEKLARELSVAHRVRFFGVHRDVAPFMQAADCLVCPSIWAEAVGLVNIEAMACGLPVLASRIGGIPEIVVDGITGVLFPPGDHCCLARELAGLMADPAALLAQGLAAHALARSRFSLQSRTDDYLEHYFPKEKAANGTLARSTA